MNTKSKRTLLPILAVVMGIAAMALRLCLYALATDHKGLLVSGHPLEIALWVLTVAAAVVTLVLVWDQKTKQHYDASFPPSGVAAAGCIAFGMGIALCVILTRYTDTLQALVCRVAGFLTVPALAAVSICRWKGKRPHFVFHAVVCVFLALHAIFRYNTWSTRPQIQDAFFPMMASVLLLLFAYCQTALDVDLGSRRMQLACGALAVFTCMAAVSYCTDPLLYITGAVWALTNLSHTAPRQAPEAPDAE